jgi:membrane protein
MVALVVIGIDIVCIFAPNRIARWSETTPGALVATAMWICCSLVFKLYVNYIGTYNATYGAIGGVIVVLLWLSMSSLAILVDAELNSVIANLALPDRAHLATGRTER